MLLLIFFTTLQTLKQSFKPFVTQSYKDFNSQTTAQTRTHSPIQATVWLPKSKVKLAVTLHSRPLSGKLTPTSLGSDNNDNSYDKYLCFHSLYLLAVLSSLCLHPIEFAATGLLHHHRLRLGKKVPSPNMAKWENSSSCLRGKWGIFTIRGNVATHLRIKFLSILDKYVL